MADAEGGAVGGEMGGGTSGGTSGGTGYGTDGFANSESGVYSSSNVASYSNTGAEGSRPLQENWTSTDETRRESNVALQAPSRGMPNTPASTSPSSSMLPASSGGGMSSSRPAEATAPSEAPQPPEEKPNSKLPGQGGTPALKGTFAKDTWYDQYKVTKNPYPFNPVTPVAGSGVKRSFFSAQAELLKAMMPGWNKQ